MSEQESKKQILKSTGILGAAQVIIILIGMVRIKILAVLLGPAGIGIAGLYQTIIELIKTLTGFGLSYSAVRDIASAVASGDEKQIAKTSLVLRRWVWATGLIGVMLVVVFSNQLSKVAFGNESYSKSITLLSIAILLSAIASGQSAILQGFRKIRDMAKANVLAALAGLVGSVIIYYFWGMKGIVTAILLIYILELLITWLFSKKIKTVSVKLSLADTFSFGKQMAKLGFFLTVSALATSATMYLVRSFVVQQEGLSSVGYFIAAWSISSVYISAIFGAMAADFYPRLSGVQKDPVAVRKMVNEQTEVAILLTAPIIIGMVSFVDLMVRIFYSRDFSSTADILNWQLTGDFFKVLSWPIGFILLAKGKGTLYIITELSWNLLFGAGVYFGWKFFGLQITGIAFLFSYFTYLTLVYIIAMRIVAFSWSFKIWRYILFFLPLLLLSFLSTKYFSQDARYSVGAILTLLAAVFAFIQLKKIINLNSFLNKFRFRKTL